MPSRSGRPTERRSRRATWFGAIATPSRGRSTDSPLPERTRCGRGAPHRPAARGRSPRRSGSCSGRPAGPRRRRAPRQTSPARAEPCARCCRRSAGRPVRGTSARRTTRSRPSRACRRRRSPPRRTRGRRSARRRRHPSAMAVAPAVSTAIDREVAVAVDAADLAAGRATVGEGDRDLVGLAGCGRWSGPGRRRRRRRSRGRPDRHRRSTGRRARRPPRSALPSSSMAAHVFVLLGVVCVREW